MKKTLTAFLGATALSLTAMGASAATLIGYSDQVPDLEVQEQGGGNEPFNTSLTWNGITSPGLAKCDLGVDNTDDFSGGGISCAGSWIDSAGATGDYASAFTLTYSDENSFSWTFNPLAVTGTSDVLYPLFVAVKQSTGFEVWQLTASELTSGTIDSNRPSISHVTFFDSRQLPPVPLPAAGWMLLAGIGGLAALRRRKTA